MNRSVFVFSVVLILLSPSISAQSTRKKAETNRLYIEDLFKRVEAMEGVLGDLPDRLRGLEDQIQTVLEQNAKDVSQQRQDLQELRAQLENLRFQLVDFRRTNWTEPRPEADTAPISMTTGERPSEPTPPEPTMKHPETSAVTTLTEPIVSEIEKTVEPTEDNPVPTEEQLTAEPTAAERLKEARSDLLRGRYRRALETYQAVVTSEATDEEMAQGLFGMGNAQLALGDYNSALTSYIRVSDDFPHTAAAPATLLKAGQTLNGLGRLDEAERTLKRLQAEYPQSEEARLAALGASLR